MSISEPARYHLYEAARTGARDDQAADALMALLPPVGWADVATKQDLQAVGDSIRGELHKEIGLVHREIGRLRGEIAHQTRTLVESVAALMVAGAGIALTTAQIVC